jgi:hypothetical protein
VHQEFVIPLTTLANEGKGALSPGQVDLIFSRVTPLHAIHEALLAEFKRGEGLLVFLTLLVLISLTADLSLCC